MAITDQDILAYAQKLLNSDSETELRSCISRSYYSSYHRGITLAEKLDVLLDSFEGGSHQKLISMFTTYHGSALAVDEKRKLKSIGYMIAQARSFRVDADYDLKKSVGTADAITTYQLAVHIIQRMDNLASTKGWIL